MVCNQKVTVSETSWGWCSGWLGIPYPCRQTKKVTKYQYDFNPTRTRLSWPFRSTYEGCCATNLYSWSYWNWFGWTGNGPWVYGVVTELFDADSLPDPEFECPFRLPQDERTSRRAIPQSR